jgi:hypothetical protein
MIFRETVPLDGAVVRYRKGGVRYRLMVPSTVPLDPLDLSGERFYDGSTGNHTRY